MRKITFIFSILISLSIGVKCVEAIVGSASEHLYSVMDNFHKSFNVYTDLNAGGNHYAPSGFMGAVEDISFIDSFTINPHSGSTCVRIIYSAEGWQGWAGIYWQEPVGNWGDNEGGYDLTGAEKLSFWARGDEGGEKVEFKMGGIGIPDKLYRDSCGPLGTGFIILSREWTLYTIDLTDQDLSHIIGGFCWVASKSDNPNGCTIYLDDIGYDKERLDEMRFLASYETGSLQVDNSIRNLASVYDNSLALMSFLIGNTQSDLKRARILADAFVYVQNHDRHFSDGRLRNAYRAGDLVNYLTGEARIPGWWDEHEQKWLEDEQQVGTFSGNMAWVMISLLNYYEKNGGEQYLDTAKEAGKWIIDYCYDTRGTGGYKGGYEGWDESQVEYTWKSTENNIGIYVALTKLYQATGDQYWHDKALHAKTFIESMWNYDQKHFWTGTLEDGVTINNMVFCIDPQTWGLMGMNDLPKYRAAISWAETYCLEDHICPNHPAYPDFTGFDFNTDCDGVWFEGTAQMCVAFQLIGEIDKLDFFLNEIRKAQNSARNNNGKGIVAACHDGLTTGFDQVYDNMLHVGSTSWYIFAEQGYNPLSIINRPPIVSDIPDVTFNENGLDNSIDLDDYINDLDNRDDEISWIYNGNTNINVAIDNITHVVTFTAAANWHGSEEVVFIATDPGNLFDSDTVNVTVNAVKELHLKLGWNLISICLDTEDIDILSVLSSIEGLYTSVWEYEANQGKWSRYITGGPVSSNDLDYLRPGKGYLIFMIQEASLLLIGREINETAIPLYKGWNLVGYNYINSQSALDALSSISGDYICVYTYDDVGEWKKHFGDGPVFLNDLNILEAGKGYWINVKNYCLWKK